MSFNKKHIVDLRNDRKDIVRIVEGCINDLSISFDKDDKIAVFDFDNTMMIGDIGDAAIAMMLENEIDIGFKWVEYLELQEIGDVKTAFTMASKIFQGFEIDCVKRFANALLKYEQPEITFFEDENVYKVFVPKPNPLTQKFIEILKNNNFEIHIITSSNRYLVSHPAKHYFDIDEKYVHGIDHKIKKFSGVPMLTDQVIDPLPIDEGKIDVFRKYVSKELPLIFGGDSRYDLPIAGTVAKDGLLVWFGDSELLENFNSDIKIILL